MPDNEEYDLNNKWVGWADGQPVKLLKYCWSKRTALIKYGQLTNFVNHRTRVVMPLREFMGRVTSIMAEIERDRTS
jgi:hypothetical protein